MITKKNINRYYFLFLASHLLLWTLIPSFTNVNLPLDTIEALAWGSDLAWGFNKHPPFSAFAVEAFYKIFGSQDWAYYFLSQLFVVCAFILVFNFSLQFFKDVNLAFLSILLLEGIFFYNYTTPEFNVNISQLPFWALSIFLTWRCIKNDNIKDYFFLGISIGLGILSKYLFIYLVIGIILMFFYEIIKNKKKIKLQNIIITGLVSLVLVSPHLFWLIDNNYTTITYGLQRTQSEGSLKDHIIFPLIFVFKQLGILSPFFLMAYFLINKFKVKVNFKNEKIIFLSFTTLVPIILIILTSVFIGANIRTMWMTPFYLFFGVLIVEIFRKNFNKANLRKFFLIFLFFFFLSPSTYLAVSLTNDFKRTDYPGKEIARLVQNRWDDNFINEIRVVVGDEWYAGNLSYHLISRPKWIIDLKGKILDLNSDEGVIYTGNPKILKKICPGVYGTIKPVGYCMIGKR